MSTPDEAIRLTDFDALSSRLSCFLKGYNPDDIFLFDLIPLVVYYQLLSIPSEFKRFGIARKLKSQFFNVFNTSRLHIEQLLSVKIPTIDKYTPLKSPMINRGTYLRTSTISSNIETFISSYPANQPVQIISLGAGNDTRCFNFLPNHPNLSYIEIDVEQTVRVKKLSILSSPKLSSIVNASHISSYPSTADELSQIDPGLHTDRYHLISYDLRNLSTQDISLIPELSSIDPSIPTLIISECCICYLSKTDSDNLISFWRRNINIGTFLVYEPLGGDSKSSNNYGDVMVKNLICRGIEMPTLMEYGTVDSQQKRFNLLIGPDVECVSMKWIYDNNIDIEEKDRLSRLEMLDELEELNLINSHYCLILAKWNK